MNNKIATLIRIDEDLYDDIKYFADKDNRSINKEIEYILKQYIDKANDEDKRIKTSTKK